MRISVFGLGYVGVVTAACLARDGHQVTGVDVSQTKVAQINDGESPIVEEGIEELIPAVLDSRNLFATTDAEYALDSSEIAIICVGTPSREDGSLDTRFVQTVIKQIGKNLRSRNRHLLIVVRSTILPGTMRSLVLPTLIYSSDRILGKDYDVIFHPEFLREGSSISDFYAPPKIVVGEEVVGSSDHLLKAYKHIDAPVFRLSYEMAEMVKFCDNTFHALKISFANEIGNFCHSMNIDSRATMDVFCADKKLNIAPAYLRPGFAFGGSCLPKDLRAFLSAAKSRNLSTPVLASVIKSNDFQIESALRRILRFEIKTASFVGLAFKPGTDDLRESPLVALAERLLGEGLQLRLFDEYLIEARLIGKNKTYIQERLPHLAKLLVASLSEVAESELIVIGHPVDAGLVQKWLQAGKVIFDLVGQESRPDHGAYFSIN